MTKTFFGDFKNGQLETFLTEKFPESKKIIIIDEKVYEIWGQELVTGVESFSRAEIITIPAGEENKVLDICSHIWEALLNYEISRKDLIINVGGGVTTDLGGFVASTYKRGISFINLPTTLMAQVDASHGGKTGIDFGGLKNVVGTFSFPEAVFADPDFLSTLPPNEVLSGFAEMLKHGLITDKDLWKNLLLTGGKLAQIQPFIEPAYKIKNAVVEKDFKEGGERKKLNFGHTIGHAIESIFLEKNWIITHGEAVVYGMVMESYISWQKGLIAENTFDEIFKGLSSFYNLPSPERIELEKLLNFMRNDKKNSGTEIKMVLLKGIGEAVIDIAVSEEEINESLKSLSYLTTS